MQQGTQTPDRLRVSAREPARRTEAARVSTVDHRKPYEAFEQIFVQRPAFLVVEPPRSSIPPAEKEMHNGHEYERWQPVKGVDALRTARKEFVALERCEDTHGAYIARDVLRCVALTGGDRHSDFPRLAAAALVRKTLELVGKGARDAQQLAAALPDGARAIAQSFDAGRITAELQKRRRAAEGDKAVAEFLDEKIHNVAMRQASAQARLLTVFLHEDAIETLSANEGGYFALTPSGEIIAAQGELQFGEVETFSFGSKYPSPEIPPLTIGRVPRTPGMHLAIFNNGLMKGRHDSAEQLAAEAAKRLRHGTPFRTVMNDMFLSSTSMADKTLWAIDLP